MAAVDAIRRFARLQAQWERLAARYLPLGLATEPWRYSRQWPAGLPGQGWKLHLSATILSAPRLLRLVGPALAGREVMFKGPADLAFLDRLNTGLDGYSQVGKCLTVYCRDEAHAVDLAAALHELTQGLPHPIVPFDRRYRPGSAVYYRYGAFDGRQTRARDGSRVGAIRNARGRLLPDHRGPGTAVPGWVEDPLAPASPAAEEKTWSPLATDYRAFKVLRQRGKGGVFLGLDLTRAPARQCVIKEGLRHGETDPYGHDGYWRTRREARVLRALARAGVAVPGVIAEFDVEGGRYMVLEHIDGYPLNEALAMGGRLLPADARRLQDGLTRLLAQVHAAGWAWRDCKPENLVLASDGRVRPVDFEGAWRLGTAAVAPWGTPGYRPPGADLHAGFDPVAEDVFALRKVLDLTAGAAVNIL